MYLRPLLPGVVQTHVHLLAPLYGVAMAWTERPLWAPAMLAPSTPQVIAAALVEPERVEFERRFREEMTAAAQSLDLTGVLATLESFRRIAEITQRQGVAAHLRMLDVVAALNEGRPVDTIPGAVHKAVIAARLGR